MASFDLAPKISAYPAIVPQTAAASNINSSPVDMAEFDSVAFITSVGAGNTNATISIAQSFYESDDNTRANATPIPTNRVLYVPTVNASNSVFTSNVVPTKRYVFVELDPTATFGSPVSVVAVRGNAKNMPT